MPVAAGKILVRDGKLVTVIEHMDADIMLETRFHHPSRVSVCAVIVAIALSVVPTLGEGQPSGSSLRLVEQFEKTHVFWEQREIAERLVAVRDPRILPRLAPWLRNEDRHLRANAAYVFAKYGEKRGFDVLCAILVDRSDRPKGQFLGGPISVLANVDDPHPYTTYMKAHYLEWQIPADRSYALGMLSDLRDRRAVPILTSLLGDTEVNYNVPSGLAKIGDKSAIPALIKSLSSEDPSFRVLLIQALERLDARDAIPALTLLLNDRDRSHVDDLIPVAEAARHAIARIEATTP